ncbi:helix-turn-helix domain-containing protein [Phaeodactylibacter xiamenensis]|uniref:helix-turn-helix domain-containing protein n=1 Tax=Phaeodactylibacter xiamenensis TaxID=1524460 RepID=UPI0024A8CC9E|nr:helix-turn-helix transcriptional regulator [Phaeodactylibacter xiamenensis]
MHIGKNIRYLRGLQRHKQKWLAEELGKSSSSITEYESGRKTPPVDVLQQLCEIYKVSLDDLVNKDLEAESYAPQQPNDSRAEYKNDVLLNKMLAIKVLELIEVIERELPEDFEKLRLQTFSETIKETFDVK